MTGKKTTGGSLKDLAEQSRDLFARTRIPFEKEKEVVWEDLVGRMQSGTARSRVLSRKLRPARQWMGLAASVALLVSATVLMRFYRVTASCPAGEQVSRELPDGSVAELNGPTALSFHPLWWPLSRRVEMEGEVFFNVTEGRSFKVSAQQGITEVLGTTFNVYAREHRFEVTCHSGRVLVSLTDSERSVTLSQDQKAELNTRGSIDIRQVTVDRSSPVWKSTLLMFTATPLRQVFDEIEMQYDIRITTPEELNYTYSGRFNKDLPVDNVLSLVCRPFDLTYEQKSGPEYHIYPASGDQ
ncbi:MAG TPA: FecR family protein [Bacteroides sp.]|nr:FecR family protein [Bacteroides sp.]